MSNIESEVDTNDLKNASQGIASTQATVLESFQKLNDQIAERKEAVHKTLTKEELERFMSDEPRVRQQKKSKDIFLFGVFTGLLYIDMKNLEYNDIKTMEDDSQWIVSKRQKTGIDYRVRLLDIPLAIIEKYREHTPKGKVLDVPNKMTVHSGLNAIAKRCGISKKMGIRMSRHTFASLITLSEGVPIETVSKMVGHEHIKASQRYAELSTDKIREDMDKLSKRISGQFTLVV